MAPNTPPSVSANQGMDKLAQNYFARIETLLESPCGPFSTTFPGRTSKEVLLPDFLAELMNMAQLLATENIIAGLNDQVPEKDNFIDDLSPSSMPTQISSRPGTRRSRRWLGFARSLSAQCPAKTHILLCKFKLRIQLPYIFQKMLELMKASRRWSVKPMKYESAQALTLGVNSMKTTPCPFKRSTYTARG